jgi:LysM repeat protein
MTDPNRLMSAQPRIATLGRIPLSPAFRVRPLTSFLACAILFLSSMTFGAAFSRAQSQDTAEAARQERARKQEKQKPKKHVYTNEDLSHGRILTPEDQAQVEARKNRCAQKNNCAPAEKSQDALDANSQKPGTSLGEIARQYRKQKENQKELDALKPKQPEPFHLPSSEPALASPIFPARRAPVAPVLRPGTNSHVMRRDPFARVPVQPARPEATVGLRPAAPHHVPPDAREEVRGDLKPDIAPDFYADVRPAFARGTRGKFPRAPRISSLRTPLSIWVQPEQPAAPVEIQPTLPVQSFDAAPAQPRNFAAVKPVVPAETTPAAPKAPALAKPVAPAMAILPVQPTVTSIRPAQRAAALPAIPSASGKTISVKPGDSLWRVAQENLGSGNRWPELAAANPWIANPNQIPAGVQLALPMVVAAPAAAAGAKRGAVIIKVRKGDTLWSLAKTNLGRWSSWPCLAAANPGVNNPNRIVEGQELAIPSACGKTAAGSLLPDEK